MKRAFTLIELLVVIAIIAILAAILFPVFAQAKQAAKKTGDLSNLKQMSVGQQVYLADSDDNMPLTVPGGLGTSLFTMPIDRTATTNPGPRSSFYGNSVFPYIKSWAMYNGPQATTFWEPFGPQTPKPVVDHAYTMNSYLNGWSATASEAPAKVVSYWPGLGDRKIAGFGMSYPLVYTRDLTFLTGQAGSENWRFQRSGASCVSNIGFFTGTDGSAGTWKHNGFGNGANMSYIDGHAKFAKFGSSDFPYRIWKAGESATRPEGTFRTWYVSNESVSGAGDENACYYSFTLSPLRS